MESKYRKFVFCETIKLHNALCKHFNVSEGLEGTVLTYFHCRKSLISK